MSQSPHTGAEDRISFPGFKNRSPRKKVRLHGRLRGESEWTDVQIKDLSARGLMAESEHPPPRGHYIEIRRHNHILIGVVAWSKGNRFGVALAEETDIESLISGVPTCLNGERRDLVKRDRKPRVLLVLSTPSDWKWAGRALERLALIAFGVIGTLFVGELVYEALATPMEAIVEGLRL
ncbi:hypothetical protein GCM10009127_08720 [Alteraurantiacibacter aestuarii]|uniref:PilZ domain-containing protein n=1 Tax=Alteraurantiacibacter aestuarii TaxID=650004 RepID=A0A844ZFF7_9SPHN|nr:PilZ domain-containing protein [Alteraurantiacibacter aestuarii]MXO87261.1 hypothetical protein [Alteraurantiacibacter aestuarii]